MRKKSKTYVVLLIKSALVFPCNFKHWKRNGTRALLQFSHSPFPPWHKKAPVGRATLKPVSLSVLLCMHNDCRSHALEEKRKWTNLKPHLPPTALTLSFPRRSSIVRLCCVWRRRSWSCFASWPRWRTKSRSTSSSDVFKWKQMGNNELRNNTFISFSCCFQMQTVYRVAW